MSKQVKHIFKSINIIDTFMLEFKFVNYKIKVISTFNCSKPNWLFKKKYFYSRKL